MASSRLEIDLGSIERNLGVIRRVVAPSEPTPGSSPSPKVGVCAVLKQDGYGAGAVRIAKRLIASGPGGSTGVDMIAVYSLDEARAIAESIPTVNILILMPVLGIDRNDPLYRHAAQGRVHLTLHSLDQFNAIHDMAGRIGIQFPLHAQVDTGMSRGGATPELAVRLVEKILSAPRVRLAGLMTHFASPCCDERFTREQVKSFNAFIERIRPAVKAAVDLGGRPVARMGELKIHAANSCAMFRGRSFHGTMVRVGQCLLGYVGADINEREAPAFEFRNQMDELEPSVRWVSSIAHISEIPAGWPVGYGSTWRAPARADGRKSRVALIPVGYADGLPRSLGGKHAGGPGWVGLTGRAYDRRTLEADTDAALDTVWAPIVGRVSMDQITVDVTDVPEPYLRPTGANGGSGGIGAEVEIYSREKGARNFLPLLAETAGTITHDLLCRVSSRVERVYRSGAPAKPQIVVRTGIHASTTR